MCSWYLHFAGGLILTSKRGKKQKSSFWNLQWGSAAISTNEFQFKHNESLIYALKLFSLLFATAGRESSLKCGTFKTHSLLLLVPRDVSTPSQSQIKFSSLDVGTPSLWHLCFVDVITKKKASTRKERGRVMQLFYNVRNLWSKTSFIRRQTWKS